MVRLDRGEQVDTHSFIGNYPEIASELHEFLSDAAALKSLVNVSAAQGRGTNGLP